MPFRVDPLLVAFVADERPQLVAFQAQPRSGAVFGHPAWHPRIEPVHVSLQPPFRNHGNTGDARQGDAFKQQSAYQAFLFRADPLFPGTLDKLAATGWATVFLAVGFRMAAVFYWGGSAGSGSSVKKWPS